MKYYNFNKVLSYNGTFNFIIGGRGLGKTYGAKKIVISNAIKKNEQFIYLRRYSSELSSISTFFSDIKHEFPDWDFRVNGRQADIAPRKTRSNKKREWRTIGYFVQLSNAMTQKSVAYPEVTTIIFDEFIIERGLVRYLPSEVKSFMEFYSTVDRWKDKTRVLFLANSVSMMNPYFLEWEIRPDQLGEFSRHHDGFIVTHFADSSEFASEVYQTKFGKFIKGTEYADYSVGSKFSDGHERLLGRKPSAASHYCNIETPSGVFSVWVDYLGPVYYIQEKVPNSGVFYTMLPERMDHNKVLLTYSMPLMQILRTAFRRARITFDSPKSRNTFAEIFKRG